MCPRLLIVSSTEWVWPARLAAAFAGMGVSLAGAFAPRSPLRHVVPPRAAYPYSGVRPLRTLAQAIETEGIHAVVPCDDRAAWHLGVLHARSRRLCRDPQRVRTVIERSLGSSVASPVLASRSDLLALAQREGIEVPATMALAVPADLDLWADRHGFPAFVKVDGTTGGAGVTAVDDLDQAKRAMRGTVDPAKVSRDFVRFLLGRDRFGFWDHVHGPERKASIQAAVKGTPANILVSCDRGEITGAICVEARATHGERGPATVVAVVRSPEMLRAATRIAGRLGLSGFVGFDFMIEQASGRPFLIEMNPRATATGHLALGEGRDLVSAFSRRLLGMAAVNRVPIPACERIALFPIAWHTDPAGLWRHEAYHDVPWEEPILMQKIVASIPFGAGLNGLAPVASAPTPAAPARAYADLL